MSENTAHLALKRMRKLHPGKLTQKAVADGVGISYGNYNKKESGQVAITLDDLDRLARFYGVEVWELIKASGSNSGEPETPDIIGDSMKRIIELTDVITTLNKVIKERDAEIDRLKKEINKQDTP